MNPVQLAMWFFQYADEYVGQHHDVALKAALSVSYSKKQQTMPEWNNSFLYKFLFGYFAQAMLECETTIVLDLFALKTLVVETPKRRNIIKNINEWLLVERNNNRWDNMAKDAESGI